MIFRAVSLSFLLLLIALPSVGQEAEVRVNLRDPVGNVITNAVVTVAEGTQDPKRCPPEDDGFVCRFSENKAVEFRIAAAGFRELRIRYAPDELICCEYVYVLQIEPLPENVVTVTRSEAAIESTPESVAVLGREAIRTTAAPMLDDALKQIPGFSIFRRSSSRNANPTTQGVSLRGVGASGASRSAVMFDGVLLNDAFGGWVQWNRIPPIAVDEVEVLRGGASSLYGGSGLSGAVDLRPRTASDDLIVSGELFGGSQRTASASAFAGSGWKGWAADAFAGHFQTRGFIPVDEVERGPVDSYAGVRSLNISTRITRKFGDFADIFFRPIYFGESRTNGTPAQINRSHSRQFVAGGSVGEKAVSFAWRAFGGTQVYDQTFSAVSVNRTSESLTRVQRSPSQYFGASGTLNSRISDHKILAGIESREVRAASDEIGYSNNNPTSRLGAGGRERTVAFFVKDLLTIGEQIILSGGLRYDRWENLRGLRVTTPLSTGIASVSTFPDRTDDAWSPSAAIQVQATNKMTLRVAAARSFRTPTLNELYRGFRVGGVVTNANGDLKAERADNFEVGAAYRFRNSAVRVTAFLTKVDDAIANVTISSTPSLITRQRRNAGETRTAGIEADVATKIGPLDLDLGYLFADSRITEFPTDPALVEKFIPQVPRHQFTFQARYPYQEWTFASQVRAASEQFDDDLNHFRLEPYFQLDAFVSYSIGKKLSLFATVENFFNTRYSAGRTPVRTVGAPVGARAGVRWN